MQAHFRFKLQWNNKYYETRYCLGLGLFVRESNGCNTSILKVVMAFYLPGTYLERQKQSQGVFQVMFIGGNSLVQSFLNLSRQLYMCKYRCACVYIWWMLSIAGPAILVSNT